MRRCRAILLTSAVCLLWALTASAADSAVTQPVRAAETLSDSAVHSAGSAEAKLSPPAATPIRSELDSEPIRHGGEAGPVDTSISHSQGMELPRVAGALAIVITLIFLLRWGGKKLFNQGIAGRSTRAVQVLARTTISPRQHILLLRVGLRVIIVGEAGSQMTALSEITDANEIASLLGQLQDEKSRLPAKAFSALFSRARQDMGGDEEELASAEEQGETQGTPGDEEQSDHPAMADTRDEISGLMDKIRVLSKHFRGGPA